MKNLVLICGLFLFSTSALAQVCPAIADGDYTCTGQQRGRTFDVKLAHVSTQTTKGLHLDIPGLNLEPFPCINTTAPQINEVCNFAERAKGIAQEQLCRRQFGNSKVVVSTTSTSSASAFKSTSIMTPVSLVNPNIKGVAEMMEVEVAKTGAESFNMNVHIITAQSGDQRIVVTCEL